MPRVAILDYGAGNIFSLKNSLEKIGAQVDVIGSLDGPDAGMHSGLILPGVGNFDPAMRRVRSLGPYAGSVPVLGICLGMEMYFEASEEGSEPGLGLIPGQVVALPEAIKAPHMGWNSLERSGDSALLQGMPEGPLWAYFVHSYMARPSDPSIVAAASDYGTSVPAVIESGQLYGTQFHPEKSGHAGSLMLANFLRECRR